ncbi:hypothetical protein C2G38_2137307 [Gigaspora rosea]|uniref:Uncharacterized protein n=1 Tax=Gigaspora rosea TaxID=44941 RepID=A0A397W4P3_9GLOM|nr:hypothetical protein C2G38_2137307 [Gigaspora rosea]
MASIIIRAQTVNPFSKGKPAGTQGFELYCIPELQEKGNSEILVNNNEDLEEKGIELNPEVVLDKLLTICLEALKWLPGFENPKPESNSPLKIINGENDLGHTYEISNLGYCYQNETRNKKDNHEAFVHYGKLDDREDVTEMSNDNKIIGEIKVVEKTSKMDHVNKPFESSLKNDIDVEKETTWNYQKTAEMDRKRKMEKLEKMNPKEKIMDSNALDESDCKTLVEDNDGMNEGNNDNKFELPLEGDALNFVCEEWIEKVNKWIEKVNEFQKVTSGINGPTKKKLTKEMSVIEIKFENNNMWFENQFDGSMVKIKESVNKSIVVAHRIDSNKEKEIGKEIVFPIFSVYAVFLSIIACLTCYHIKRAVAENFVALRLCGNTFNVMGLKLLFL